MASEDNLTKPVQFLKGVGPKRANLLKRLNLHIARDLLFHFPRDYQDVSELCTVEQLEENQPVSVCGYVEEVELRNTGLGRSILGVLVRQGAQFLRAVWFNQPYMRQRFTKGQRVLLSGKARLNEGRWEMAHPHVESLGRNQEVSAGRILSIYPLTDGLNQGQLRRILQHVIDTCLEEVEEVFPDEYLNKHALWPIQTALPQIHFPIDRASLAQARRRFVYQELFILQLAVALRRQSLTTGGRAAELPMTAKIDSRIRRLLPFDLTTSQSEAVAEITADMARSIPMNRLLQGDVGSGKTVVAVYAMLAAVAHGHQAVLMAPTEVLARQHEQTLGKILGQSQVRMALLIGSLPRGRREEILRGISVGELDLIVGTQALLQSGVEFAKLGLAVIDEQHKFGVQQRAGLRRSGLDAHYLVMTATPIPRTISMTMFGDLNVTTLHDSPPGRQNVHTYLGDDTVREKWWDFFRRKLGEGRQGYVVTPRVEGSEDEILGNVEEAFENLSNGELEEFRLNLIHGRLASEEKQAAMTSFYQGDTQVLVATSVVEVGVDVPNATVMTIENGERFGLAQLHQLRGRISRGTHSGYLCVFADAKTDEARDRLQAFVKTNDGFQLAEVDFRLRGPGDLFSTKQHGLPSFRIADLNRDADTLEQARRDAQTLVAADPQLEQSPHRRLRRMVIVRYGQALELSDVG